MSLSELSSCDECPYTPPQWLADDPSLPDFSLGEEPLDEAPMEETKDSSEDETEYEDCEDVFDIIRARIPTELYECGVKAIPSNIDMWAELKPAQRMCESADVVADLKKVIAKAKSKSKTPEVFDKLEVMGRHCNGCFARLLCSDCAYVFEWKVGAKGVKMSQIKKTVEYHSNGAKTHKMKKKPELSKIPKCSKAHKIDHCAASDDKKQQFDKLDPYFRDHFTVIDDTVVMKDGSTFQWRKIQCNVCCVYLAKARMVPRNDDETQDSGDGSGMERLLVQHLANCGSNLRNLLGLHKWAFDDVPVLGGHEHCGLCPKTMLHASISSHQQTCDGPMSDFMNLDKLPFLKAIFNPKKEETLKNALLSKSERKVAVALKKAQKKRASHNLLKLIRVGLCVGHRWRVGFEDTLREGMDLTKKGNIIESTMLTLACRNCGAKKTKTAGVWLMQYEKDQFCGECFYSENGAFKDSMLRVHGCEPMKHSPLDQTDVSDDVWTTKVHFLCNLNPATCSYRFKGTHTPREMLLHYGTRHECPECTQHIANVKKDDLMEEYIKKVYGLRHFKKLSVRTRKGYSKVCGVLCAKSGCNKPLPGSYTPFAKSGGDWTLGAKYCKKHRKEEGFNSAMEHRLETLLEAAISERLRAYFEKEGITFEVVVFCREFRIPQSFAGIAPGLSDTSVTAKLLEADSTKKGDLLAGVVLKYADGRVKTYLFSFEADGSQHGGNRKFYKQMSFRIGAEYGEQNVDDDLKTQMISDTLKALSFAEMMRALQNSMEPPRFTLYRKRGDGRKLCVAKDYSEVTVGADYAATVRLCVNDLTKFCYAKDIQIHEWLFGLCINENLFSHPKGNVIIESSYARHHGDSVYKYIGEKHAYDGMHYTEMFQEYDMGLLIAKTNAKLGGKLERADCCLGQSYDSWLIEKKTALDNAKSSRKSAASSGRTRRSGKAKTESTADVRMSKAKSSRKSVAASGRTRRKLDFDGDSTMAKAKSSWATTVSRSASTEDAPMRKSTSLRMGGSLGRKRKRKVMSANAFRNEQQFSSEFGESFSSTTPMGSESRMMPVTKKKKTRGFKPPRRVKTSKSTAALSAAPRRVKSSKSTAALSAAPRRHVSRIRESPEIESSKNESSENESSDKRKKFKQPSFDESKALYH